VRLGVSEERRVVNTLAVVAYPDLATAKRVRHELVEAVREGHAHLEDAVVVERALHGEVKVHQLKNAAAGGAAAGATGGALGARLRPGAAALIVLGSADSRDEIIERVKPYGGEVLQASLSSPELKRLREALAEGATPVHGST
jgi:uncharacterized membrane protein